MELGALIAALAAIVGATVSFADARRQVAEARRENERVQKKVDELERVKASRSDIAKVATQESIDRIDRDLARLDRDKASTENVEGVRADIRHLETRVLERIDDIGEMVRAFLKSKNEDTNA